jgi:hypothetical protein
MSGDEFPDGRAVPRSRAGLPVGVAICLCLALVSIELGWVSFFRHAWGFNLWQYLSPPATVVLSLAVLLLCWRRFRGSAIRAAQSVYERAHGSAPRLIGWLAFIALPFAFWMLRERRYFGDSAVHAWAAAAGWEFTVPDIGSTYLFSRCFALSRLLDIDGVNLVRALVCVSGGVAVGCFVRMSRYVAPTPGRGALAAGLILCGGALRVFAGHVEVYVFVLMCGGAYFWSACAFLAGRCHWAAPCLVLGVGIWMHLSLIMLAPTLLYLFALAEPSRAVRQHAGRWVAALALASAPTVLFLLAMLATADAADLDRAREKTLQILGATPVPRFGHYWLLQSGEASGAGSVVRAHLKYLANALFILAPSAVPVLAGFALVSFRRFYATPQARFFSAASVCLLAYASVLRPLWGPHDWDLFTLTAICLASLAALLLVNETPEPLLSHLSTLLIGATLLFVTIPFLAAGIAPSREAGPFTHQGIWPNPSETAWEAFLKEMEPWL